MGVAALIKQQYPAQRRKDLKDAKKNEFTLRALGLCAFALDVIMFAWQ
jgi:hypothetical protein